MIRPGCWAIGGSAEVVGSAILTFIVGQLLPLGWPAIFAVYGGGYLILLLYLLFVPYPKEKKQANLKVKKVRIRPPSLPSMGVLV